MLVYSDLHIHSCHSRACSKNINIDNLEKFARIKGINLLGTGDFQHPLWIKELKGNLEEDGSGILKTKSGFNFLLSTELSNIYTQNGKGRRVHNVILAPSLEVVDQITEELGKRGRLDYDGRPIFGFSCIELVEMMKGVSKDIEIIPAHVWTPHFGCVGASSGFNSIEECFKDQAKHIHALETGLSSDPGMNWRLSKLDDIQLVSFSDSHSYWPHRIGREATVFDLKELNYKNVLNAIRTGSGLKETYEYFPDQGKYHWDGHRKCGVCLEPAESNKNRGMCPKCGRPLTIGVLNRVEELADRPDGFKPENAVPYKSLIPLSEIICHFTGGQPTSKKVWEVYNKIIDRFGNEFKILLEAGQKEIESVCDSRIAEAIVKVRNGNVKFRPGYDGVYGIPIIGNEKHEEEKQVEIKNKQKNIMEF